MRHFQRFLFLAALMFGSIVGEEAGAQFVQQGMKLVGTGTVGLARQGSFRPLKQIERVDFTQRHPRTPVRSGTVTLVHAR